MKSILKGLMATIVLLSVTVSAQDKNQAGALNAVYENYFEVKDALVKSNGEAAATESAELLSAIKAVKMKSLTTAEHSLWMKTTKELSVDAERIAETKDIKHQRDYFITLSGNIYKLIKVSNLQTPIYYQHCPMANDGKGANWLSKENAVKNPYYGNRMLTCGRVDETIK